MECFMRAFLVPAMAAFALAASSAAFAAEKATGVVKSFDASAHTLTLDNGATYMLEGKAMSAKVKAGEKVEVKYVMKDGKQVAHKIKEVK
jgi:Cu/Ag efflux protein CusF